MSRKNLSRTVIEGGRYHRNQFQRRGSHRAERASTRAWLDRVEVDADDAEYTAPPPLRRVYKSFYDKLAPAKRWLASQVGRPWDNVYHELRTTFDRKTIAGNHVVEHMLDWVHRGEPIHRLHGREPEFVVDKHGILRRGRFYGQSWSRLRREALAWAQSRRVAETNLGLWWVRVTGIGERCSTYPCGQSHEQLYDGAYFGGRYHVVQRLPLRALSPGDLKRFANLPRDLRRMIEI